MRISDWSSDVCSSDLVDLVSGDQALMRREIEKIALYLDAGPDRQRQVTAADIAAPGAATHEEDVSECINVALGGKVRDMPEKLATAAAVGVAQIPIIRELALRALSPIGKTPSVARVGQTG